MLSSIKRAVQSRTEATSYAKLKEAKCPNPWTLATVVAYNNIGPSAPTGSKGRSTINVSTVSKNIIVKVPMEAKNLYKWFVLGIERWTTDDW